METMNGWASEVIEALEWLAPDRAAEKQHWTNELRRVLGSGKWTPGTVRQGAAVARRLMFRLRTDPNVPSWEEANLYFPPHIAYYIDTMREGEVKRREPVAVSLFAAEALLSWAERKVEDQKASPRELLFALAALTGCRRQELAALSTFEVKADGELWIDRRAKKRTAPPREGYRLTLIGSTPVQVEAGVARLRAKLRLETDDSASVAQKLGNMTRTGSAALATGYPGLGGVSLHGMRRLYSAVYANTLRERSDPRPLEILFAEGLGHSPTSKAAAAYMSARLVSDAEATVRVADLESGDAATVEQVALAFDPAEQGEIVADSVGILVADFVANGLERGAPEAGALVADALHRRKLEAPAAAPAEALAAVPAPGPVAAPAPAQRPPAGPVAALAAVPAKPLEPTLAQRLRVADDDEPARPVLRGAKGPLQLEPVVAVPDDGDASEGRRLLAVLAARLGIGEDDTLELLCAAELARLDGVPAAPAASASSAEPEPVERPEPEPPAAPAPKLTGRKRAKAALGFLMAWNKRHGKAARLHVGTATVAHVCGVNQQAVVELMKRNSDLVRRHHLEMGLTSGGQVRNRIAVVRDGRSSRDAVKAEFEKVYGGNSRAS